MKNPKNIAMVFNSSPEESSFLNSQFTLLKKEFPNLKALCLSVGNLSRFKKKQDVICQWPIDLRFPFFYLAAFFKCLIKSPGCLARYFYLGAGVLGLGVLKQFFLNSKIISLNPEVLHFQFGAIAISKIHLKKILGCKILVSFRGYDLNYVGLENPDYYSEVWKEADVIHVLGHDLWKRALQRGCPPDKRHVFIPPGIDPEFFQFQNRIYEEKIGTKERPVRILSVGRLVWKKGYEYALQAVRLLREREIFVDYRIIGTGDYLEAVAFTRHQLKLEDCVQLLGAKTSGELKTELEQADLFLHAAVSEGFCNAVVEAQSMGLAVVTSDADGLGENIADGQTGFVVPRRDPKALAEKMILLIQSSEVRRQMGQKGRERVLKYFKIENQIIAFVKIYGEP